ncbi:hypothetical protein GF336_00320 [Candidatus Woesearchaeota archaeon]|nr:hypothetical protein [Candidatus Woesearchaeota archaeon]
MVLKRELIKVLKICKKALDSCSDNYGSESADNGDYEKYFDDDLIEKAKREIAKLNQKR